MAGYKPFFRHFKNGSDFNMNVDGSIVEQVFTLQPPADRQWAVNSIVVFISDNNALDAHDYGAINGGLLNGTKMQIYKGGDPVFDALEEIGIKTNQDWSRLNFDITPNAFDQQQKYLTVTWPNKNLTGMASGIVLNGETNDKIDIIIRDDLTTLLSHTATAGGAEVGLQTRL